MPMDNSKRNPNQQLEHPLALYKERYRALDPHEAAGRCRVPFDEGEGAFTLTLLSHPLKVSWPEYKVSPAHPDSCPKSLYTGEVQILIIRFLLEGRMTEPTGRFIAYREMPWGAVYDKNFEGRCIKRLAYGFGSRLDAFARAAARLGGVPGPKGDASADLPFLPDIRVRVALWAGDDEFPPNSQILFSGNVPDAFSTEDAAVIGDVLIDALKELSK